MNAMSGLVGAPTQTIDGITIRCLLNPNIRTGGVVRIDNASITQTTLKRPLGTTDPFYIPSLAADGNYKIYSMTHIGDTRGQEWYSEIIGANVNSLPKTRLFQEAVLENDNG